MFRDYKFFYLLNLLGKVFILKVLLNYMSINIKLLVRSSITVTKSNEDRIVELDNYVKKHAKELIVYSMHDKDFERLERRVKRYKERGIIVS